MFGLPRITIRQSNRKYRWEGGTRYDLPKTQDEMFWRQDRRLSGRDGRPLR